MDLKKLGILFLLMVTVGFGWFFTTSPRIDSPILGEVGDFTLVDQEEKPFKSASLKGHTSVINFIFTSCQGSCPVLTRQMYQIQKKVTDPRVRYYSISVDPDYDTPERLKAFAEKYQVDFERWKFLTGDLKEIRRAVVESFLTALGDRKVTSTQGKDFIEITHGEKFVIVDAEKRIRAFHSAKTEKEIEEILKIIHSLSSLEAPLLNSQT